VLCCNAVQRDQDQSHGDARDGSYLPQPGQRSWQADRDRASDGHQTAEHEDQAEDDGHVIGDPDPALSDRSGHALRVSDGCCRVEEVPDHR
jgi:hypothetical protein